MDDQRKERIDPEEPHQGNRPKQLQAHKLPTYVVENINSTNKERGVLLINKSWIVSRGKNRMLQRIQSLRRFTLHISAHLQRD